MFLNLWSKPRNEQTMQEKVRLRPSSPSRSPLSHATPLLNKMKRKRDDSSPISPRLEVPAFKRIETMSHVEIPAYDIPRVAPTSHTTQTDTRAPKAFLASSPQENANQQTNVVCRRNAQTNSLPRGSPASRMDMDQDLEIQGSKTTSSSKIGSSLASIRPHVESQFSLEILLKHRELRLIDQELAKCQVALEQLRRCKVIPYPAMSSNLVDMQAVSNGSGVVYDNPAPQAPSWGVTDGPYTQHYARWLLQDPVFDGKVSDGPIVVPAGQAGPERQTRGSKSEKSAVASKSRSSRGTSNAKLTALPDGYPVPREEKGPCIVTRSSDGKKVKLVCLEPSCRRSDFNSAQGFINHVRIAHLKAFSSHDAAIEACGEEIDGDGEGAGGEVGGPRGTTIAGLVHPLVRLAFSHSGSTTPGIPTSTPSPKKRKGSASSTTSAAAAAISPKKRKGSASSTASAAAAAASSTEATPFAPQRLSKGNLDGSQGSQQPFNPSPQTPHLSALLAKLGKGGDLGNMVLQATTKPEVDFDQLSDDDDEEDATEEESQLQPMVKSHSTRGVIRQHAPAEVNTSSSHRNPQGMDGTNDTTKTADFLRHHPAYPSPNSIRPDDAHSEADTSMLDINTPLNLSPNTTDPHPAPSLVSDDGDYENMHSDSESPSEMGDERDAHHEPEVMDHDAVDLGEGSGLNLGHAKQHHHHHGTPTEMVAVGRRSRPSTASKGMDHADERHVSFASPSQGLRREPKAKDVQ